MLVKAITLLTFFAVLSSNLKQRYFFHEKKTNIYYSFSLLYIIDVNWPYISCKVTKKSSESNKQDDCYLVLLKVQYGSSHFWIFLKALSLDYWPKAKELELIQLTDIKQRKAGVDIFSKIENLLQKEVEVIKTTFCKVSKLK